MGHEAGFDQHGRDSRIAQHGKTRPLHAAIFHREALDHRLLKLIGEQHVFRVQCVPGEGAHVPGIAAGVGRAGSGRCQAINLDALHLIFIGHRRVEMQADEQIGAPLSGDLRPVGQRNKIVAVACERDFQSCAGQQVAHVPREQQRVFFLLSAALFVARILAAVAGVEANAQDRHTHRVPGRKEHRLHGRLQIQQRDKHGPIARGNRGGEVHAHAVDCRFV